MHTFTASFISRPYFQCDAKQKPGHEARREYRKGEPPCSRILRGDCTLQERLWAARHAVSPSTSTFLHRIISLVESHAAARALHHLLLTAGVRV